MDTKPVTASGDASRPPELRRQCLSQKKATGESLTEDDRESPRTTLQLQNEFHTGTQFPNQKIQHANRREQKPRPWSRHKIGDDLAGPPRR